MNWLKRQKTLLLGSLLVISLLVAWIKFDGLNIPSSPKGLISFELSSKLEAEIILKEWKIISSEELYNASRLANYWPNKEGNLLLLAKRAVYLDFLVILFYLLFFVSLIGEVRARVKKKISPFHSLVTRILKPQKILWYWLLFAVIILVGIADVIENICLLENLYSGRIIYVTQHLSSAKFIGLYILLLFFVLVWGAHWAFKVFVRAFTFYLPVIILLVIVCVAFSYLSQGEDLLIIIGESPWSSFIFIFISSIWALVVWYSSRLATYVLRVKLGSAKNSILDFSNQRMQKERLEVQLHHLMPRLLGWSCLIILQLCLLSLPNFYWKEGVELTRERTPFILFLLGVVLNLFVLFIGVIGPVFDWSISNRFKAYIQLKITNRIKQSGVQLHWIVLFSYGFIAALTALLQLYFGENNKPTAVGYYYLMAISLFFASIIFAAFVEIRRSLLNNSTDSIEPIAEAGFIRRIIKLIDPDFSPYEFEFFRIFLFSSILLLAIYISGLLSIPFSTKLSPGVVFLLCFCLLTGTVNILSLLKSKTQINWIALTVLLIIFFNNWSSPYIIPLKNSQSNDKKYDKRPDLIAYMKKRYRQEFEIAERGGSEDHVTRPLFFLMSDGGASRSAYWVVSVMDKLDSMCFDEKNLLAISGASGGTVGNVIYYSHLKQKNDDEWMKQTAGKDYLSAPLIRLLGLDLFAQALPFVNSDRGRALEKSFEVLDDYGILKKNFSDFILQESDLNYSLPLLFLNTTRVQDGKPGVISNIKIDNKNAIYNGRIDVLDLISYGNQQFEMSISSAMIMSSRFPYVSPAANLRGHFFVDGGYFDNSGAGTTLETMRAIDHYFDSKGQRNPFSYHVIHIKNSPKFAQNHLSMVSPIGNDVAAPLLTLAGSYGEQTGINDERLRQYLMRKSELDKVKHNYFELELYTSASDYKEIPFAFNWAMSEWLKQRMDDKLKKIDPLIFDEIINLQK